MVSNQQTRCCLKSRIVLWWIWNLTNFQVRRRKIAMLIWHTLWMPTAKYLARKKEISSLKQHEGEVFYDAWERFKLLLKRCPGHKLSEMDIIQVFTTRLKLDTRMLLDASWGGIDSVCSIFTLRSIYSFFLFNFCLMMGISYISFNKIV